MRVLAKYICLLALLTFESCSETAPTLISSDGSYEGTYFDPLTGEILFTIFQDSSGYRMKDIGLDPYVFGESKFEKVMIPNEEIEERWGNWCKGDMHKIMSRALGGEDWKDNLIWYVEIDDMILMKVLKGYQSREHVYNTDYALVVGNDCFNRLRSIRNIDKLK